MTTALTTLAEATGGVPLAVDLMVILFVAALVATVFARLRLESIPGFLIAGVLIGPGALGLVQDSPRIEQISQLAVIFLMFGVGLHLDPSTMGRGAVHILGIGAISTVSVMGLSAVVLMAAGVDPPVAVLLGMVAGQSSTSVLVRLVTARREIRTVHSRVGLGISIVQDLSAVVLLGLLPPLARWSGVSAAPTAARFEWMEGLPRWAEFIASAAVSTAGLAFLIVLGRAVLPRAMRAVAVTGSSELMIVFAAAIALGAAVGSRVLGFSAEMGAFLAGFLLASTPYRHQLSGQIASLRDVLMAVFFTAVGLSVDAGAVAGVWWIVGLCAVGLVVLKTAVIGVTGWALGMSPRSALLTGFYLSTAGEIALVLVGPAVALGLLSGETLDATIAVIVLSLIVVPLGAPLVHALGDRAAGWRQAGWVKSAALLEPAPVPVKDGEGEGGGPSHVVIAGFGPVGRAIADRLDLMSVPVTIVELNPRTIERQAQIGRRRVVYGDIGNPEVLDSAGVRGARAVIITIPDDEVAMRAIRAARSLAPDVFIAARTNFLSGAFKAQQLGADHVTVEEVATADAMQREVIEALRRRDGGLSVSPTA
ncbi:MAG: cation:proton antiporter [Phycisphaeraceae bacterium]|nr:MAG: cation:proton antiporter [Phycisphaeraceae bacterium]